MIELAHIIHDDSP